MEQEQALEKQIQALRETHKSLLSRYVSADTDGKKAQYRQKLEENEKACAKIQEQLNKRYIEETKIVMPHPPVMKNVWHAFLVGGLICSFGQIVIYLMQTGYAMEFRNASAMASAAVVIITAILTGIGIYDEIGRFGGAGSMVPISGFSNSIVSAALEWKASGMIYGIGAKIFTIAGPVILYGTMASVCLGLIYYVLH